ncbi:transposase zinc-binding domain-containing protein [bacterium]|nr:transposase zinc-binding domain-containing protein [bacterium]
MAEESCATNPATNTDYSYHSCKNRSCTKCGNHDATRWLATQNVLLLPVPYKTGGMSHIGKFRFNRRWQRRRGTGCCALLQR